MKRRQTDTSDAPARERGRLSRSLPVLAGAVIAAAGLAYPPRSRAGPSKSRPDRMLRGPEAD